MALGGGGSLEWMRPVQPDGNRYPDRLGCHVGDTECFNIRCPQPGWIYAFPRRNQGQVNHFLRIGGRVIGPDDPEMIGIRNDPNFQAAGLDTSMGMGDVIAMKIPLHVVERRRKERSARNRAALAQASAAYLDGGSDIERRLSSPDRPIRFKDPRHGITEETLGS